MTRITNAQTNGPCPNWSFSATTNRISNAFFTYDAAGNLTKDGKGAGTHTYQWDAENRLKSVDTGSTASYTYNALGQRVEKNLGGIYTEVFYHGSGEPVGENNRTSWTQSYVPFAGRHVAHYQNNATYFTHGTSLGSTAQVTDYTGAVAQDQFFYPWGQQWSMLGTMQENRFARLPERDSETSLDAAHFRAFSSTQGRWFSADPLRGSVFNPQDLNRYAYTTNNPRSRIDPWGNFGFYPYCDPYDPYDPYCYAFFGFFGIITITVTCPDNRCSCCPYYDTLAATGPSELDRLYAEGAKLICQSGGTGCTGNCTRQCLVNYSIENCSTNPDPIARNSCRLIDSHLVCIPKCVLIGAFLENFRLTIIVPFPVFLPIVVPVGFECDLAPAV